MTRQTFDMSCIDFATVWDRCKERAYRSPHYSKAMDHVCDAERAARVHNLRFNRKTNVMRDDRLGVLSRPVDPSEWPEATPDEARQALADEIWCDAVRRFNVANA